MFSGIIESMGTLESCSRTRGGARMVVDVRGLAAAPAPGDSIAVDGVCLTVEKVERGRASFVLSEETLRKTRFGALHAGASLNLERAVRAEQALGGHIVTGHVDGMCSVRGIRKGGDSAEVEFSIAPAQEMMLVPKGSVAINGVSLTVASLGRKSFKVALIPYTLRATNLSAIAAGQSAHFEGDIIGKYVFRYMSRLGARRGSQ